MNVLYVLGGITCLAFGIWQTINKAKNIANGRKSLLGSDIQLLGVGIMFTIIGAFLIAHYI
jgi:hypothetical protein